MRRGAAEPARTAIVIGGSFAGMLSATALATNGYEVTLLERDRLPAGVEHRRGVPQDRQAHILLHRGLEAIDGLLPGFGTELLGRGGVPFDTGQMPWLSEYGWLSTELSSWEIVSATRPLMESVARDLLRRQEQVRICDGARVVGLRRASSGWHVSVESDGGDGELAAAVVVDASGRSSRLARWLPDLGGGQEDLVDARVGYTGRLYAARTQLPLGTGLAVLGTVPGGESGLALPVEDGQWMIGASGMGDSRPPRDPVGFERFLAGLRDPAVADLVGCLEPVTDPTVNRQTANRRRRWGTRSDWPSGLLVVGDALCAFNPIYGQGITVAALQAELVRDAAAAGRPVDRPLQREVLAVTDLPWSIATGNDQKYLHEGPPRSRAERLAIAYTSRLARLSAAGNLRAERTFGDIYHLMAPPTALFHPALLLAAARPLPQRRRPRPAVLDELTRLRQGRPPAAPASA